LNLTPYVTGLKSIYPRANARRVTALFRFCRRSPEQFRKTNEENDFSLVPKSPSAIERTESGTKHVLSGMVAETLALARKTRPLRIVVVDDEKMHLDLYQTVIRENFKDVIVLTFGDGREAGQVLSHSDPDLLITDDRMPVMSGQELCQRQEDYMTREEIESCWKDPDWPQLFESPRELVWGPGSCWLK
jgi:hypothetical protein